METNLPFFGIGKNRLVFLGNNVVLSGKSVNYFMFV